MSGLFGQYLRERMDDPAVDPIVDTPIAPNDDTVPSIDPTLDPVIDEPPMDDPVMEEDRFAEQRARRNSERDPQSTGIEDLSGSNEPVDGKDDDMHVGGTKTDLPLKTGHFEALDEETIAFDNELDQLEQEENEIYQLEDQMSMLSDTAVAIENFGINPTAFAIMRTTGLLSGTALESLGLESIQFHGKSDHESILAIEALNEQIEEKKTSWAGKILSVAKNAGGKLLSGLTSMFTKITGMVSSLGSKLSNSAAGRTVKAHPYATITAVVAAIAAVGGIVAFAGGNFPALSSKAEAVQAFGKHIVEQAAKIKLPWIKNPLLKMEGVKIVPYNQMTASRALVVVSQPANKLGWSNTAVKAVGGSLTRAFDSVKHGWTAFGSRAGKIAAGASSAVSGAASSVASSKAAGSVVNATTRAAGAVGDAAAKVGSAAAKHGTNVANHALTGGDKVAQAAFKGAKYAGASKGLAAKIGDTLGVAAAASTLVGYVIALVKLTRFVVVGGFKMIMATFRSLMGGGTAEPAAA